MPEGLRVRTAALQLIGLAAVVVLAAGARARLPLGELYPLKSAAWFAVIATLAVVFIDDDTHPFNRLGPANRVTTARAVLVAFVAGAIGEPASPVLAASVAAAALAVTMMDGVDGWMARRSRMASRFGARFDMEIDALLILALSVLAWRDGKAGSWVIASGLLRYLFVAAGALAPWLRGPLPPSRRRQTICVIQIAALTIVMLPAIKAPASTLLAAIALAALTGSVLVDIVWLWRNAA